MRSLKTTSGNFETTFQFGTWKRMQESCQRLQQLLESGGYSDCWKLQMDHCGRNTHFRQICFSVPNFNFKYVYIKFEELRDN